MSMAMALGRRLLQVGGKHEMHVTVFDHVSVCGRWGYQAHAPHQCRRGGLEQTLMTLRNPVQAGVWRGAKGSMMAESVR